MQMSDKKIKRLMAQYPFLRKVAHECSLVDEELARLQQVEINVQRADCSLMFRQADNVGYPHGNSARIIDFDENLDGTRIEYIYPVSRIGELGMRRSWVDHPDMYVRDLLSDKINDWSPADGRKREYAVDVVGSMVWVTSEIWYPRHAPLFDTNAVKANLRLTVYLEPKSGWSDLYIKADPQVNVLLAGSNLWPSPQMSDSYRYVIRDRLRRLSMEFGQRVYSDGLSQMVARSWRMGMSGQFGDIRMLVYTIAGTTSVQLEHGGSKLTLIGASDGGKLGFNDIYGTLPEAIQMAEAVMNFWESAPKSVRDQVLVDDDNVTLSF